MNDPVVFVKWVDFLKWFLLTTDKFPKKARFTFTVRMQQLALDIVEDLVEARYAHNNTAPLKRINLKLEKLRILVRLCFELRFLPSKAYEHAGDAMNEIGRMIGGWLKYKEKQA